METSEELIERMRSWPVVEEDLDFVSTLTRAVPVVLGNVDCIRVTRMLYDDRAFGVLVRPVVRLIVNTVEQQLNNRGFHVGGTPSALTTHQKIHGTAPGNNVLKERVSPMREKSDGGKKESKKKSESNKKKI